MRFFFRMLTPLILVGLLLTPSANAMSTGSLPFSEPDFEWLSQGGGTPYHLWTAGDYWRQTFVGTGLASATDLSLDLVIENAAPASEDLNFDAFVNSTNVGNFTINANTPGLYQFSYSFGPIAGDSYSLELVATNTISDGAGSFSLALADQVSFATLSGTPAIPEPSTVVLMGLGLIGLGYAGRRKLMS